jgi:hypothetical protein
VSRACAAPERRLTRSNRMPRINRYYRVRFEDDRALRDWATGVMRLAMRPLGLSSAGAGDRAVVFVPLRTRPGALAFGYVSDDARVLADAVAPGGQLDGTVVPLDELPEGLTLLYGDGGDADAYERR